MVGTGIESQAAGISASPPLCLVRNAQAGGGGDGGRSCMRVRLPVGRGLCQQALTYMVVALLSPRAARCLLCPDCHVPAPRRDLSDNSISGTVPTELDQLSSMIVM